MMPPCGLAFGQVNLLRRYPSGGRKAGPEAVGDMRGNEKPPRRGRRSDVHYSIDILSSSNARVFIAHYHACLLVFCLRNICLSDIIARDTAMIAEMSYQSIIFLYIYFSSIEIPIMCSSLNKDLDDSDVSIIDKDNSLQTVPACFDAFIIPMRLGSKIKNAIYAIWHAIIIKSDNAEASVEMKDSTALYTVHGDFLCIIEHTMIDIKIIKK
ncbi:hypothetical protein FVW20_02945 [Desulfovibrio oxamicus]|uniref:Uncharacterized protein n=1 Tax=Nitratidesulfovibrio oxamicus TaxID=32016 RepID=A0ABS0J0Q6_9BACT|nr:hypothetical protein [Nitratidesulfovibrio oxamicus]MBG3876009.1 hypothetical protein [Nitratidesulfovibrio oxamicus]